MAEQSGVSPVISRMLVYYFEILASLDDPPHGEKCACQPRQVKRACLQKVLTLMARNSPGIFDLVEAWALADHDHRH